MKHGPLDWLKNLLDGNKKDGSRNKNNKFYYAVILVLAGVALMLISDLAKPDKKPEPATVFKEDETDGKYAETFGSKKSAEDAIKLMEKQYEDELKEVLDQIVGVHDVKVFVNIEATKKNVYEKNAALKNQTTVEEDKEGGTRKIEDQSTEDELVLIREGDKEVPLISETKKPEIKGVLIVAGGAENIQIKKWIVEAVTRGLDVPSHKVAVMPKKSKGDS
ncbi:stage III sporulation protein AG [Siminovitchia sp. 179-K 8D1 HS]|uniref:stage III sporulation protein AG n=1 Tax=Siminovitchia sp. 179-K 8D1 HS TaxID=3142385 RepID=UPI0039A125B9